MQQYIAWLLAFMLTKAPVDRPHYIPEAKETQDETRARYEQIANDIADVLKTEKPLFKGADGKIRTSSVILSVMFHESGFRRDVDLGLGKLARGDHGNSVCMMQLNIGKGKTMKWNTVQDRAAYPNDPPAEVQDGWTASEVLADRKKCIRAGLRLLRLSFKACPSLPQKDALRVYGSGSCEGAAKESASRMGLAMRWYAAHPPGFDDSVLLPPPPAPPAPPAPPSANAPKGQALGPVTQREEMIARLLQTYTVK